MKNSLGVILAAGFLLLTSVALAKEYLFTATSPVIIDSPASMLTRTDEIKSRDEAFQDMVVTIVTWQKFFDALNEHNEVTILWHGNGGWNLVLEHIVSVLKTMQQEKHIDVIAVGFSASAHANALCEIDNVKFSSSAVLMFHDVIGIDGTLAKDPSPFTECVKKGILTSEDVEAIMQGMEVWIIYGKETKEVRYVPDRRLKENQ